MYHYQRFCSFRASSHIAMHTQGVASLALGITCCSSRALKGQKHYSVL